VCASLGSSKVSSDVSVYNSNWYLFCLLWLLLLWVMLLLPWLWLWLWLLLLLMQEALEQTGKRLRAFVDGGRLRPVHTSFRYLHSTLALLDLPALDEQQGLSGIMLDLGVSSHQIDADYRGFSFRHDGDLDMRMDATSDGMTARDFLNTCEPADLVRVLKDYGEEKYARPIARAIIAARPLDTTSQLVTAIESETPEPMRTKTMARVFQALRILVNDELGELEAILLDAANLVKPGGRIAILSYHSLEDRRAKNVMRSGNLNGRMVQDEMGNVLSHWRPLTRKPVVATDEEVGLNRRSRSAKLRVAERTDFEVVPWKNSIAPTEPRKRAALWVGGAKRQGRARG